MPTHSRDVIQRRVIQLIQTVTGDTSFTVLPSAYLRALGFQTPRKKAGLLRTLQNEWGIVLLTDQGLHQVQHLVDAVVFGLQANGDEVIEDQN